MAIRLNYTGRAKINTEDARFRLRTDGGHTTFDATLRLHDYHIAESDARVWVEAYHRTTLMRFDFGRAGLVAPPAERRLTLFPDPNTVLFRVKVTSTSAADAGKLLAEADGLKPRRPDEKDEDRIPLLPVRQGLLGAELWRVEYTGAGESPELVINAAAAGGLEGARPRLLVHPTGRAGSHPRHPHQAGDRRAGQRSGKPKATGTTRGGASSPVCRASATTSRSTVRLTTAKRTTATSPTGLTTSSGHSPNKPTPFKPSSKPPRRRPDTGRDSHEPATPDRERNRPVQPVP